MGLDRKKIKLSKISTLHYIKLVFRSALFIAAAVFYITRRLSDLDDRFPVIYAVIWFIFAVEMLFRLFPSRLESMGCQKQFARNYRPTGPARPDRVQPWQRTLLVAVSWLLLNGGIGALYLLHIADREILLLICLFYSVCDMICILFFCPFQTWMMKNKCCGSCRIYNWDYAMMFTPFVFIKSFYSWTLLGLSLVLLIKWELTYRLHPERFYEQTNSSLACANCEEKLCSHKKQLRRFLRELHRRAD